MIDLILIVRSSRRNGANGQRCLTRNFGPCGGKTATPKPILEKRDRKLVYIYILYHVYIYMQYIYIHIHTSIHTYTHIYIYMYYNTNITKSDADIEDMGETPWTVPSLETLFGFFGHLFGDGKMMAICSKNCWYFQRCFTFQATVALMVSPGAPTRIPIESQPFQVGCFLI